MIHQLFADLYASSEFTAYIVLVKMVGSQG